MRGYQLKRWRYSGSFETRVEQALVRETWSEEEWSEWQQERMAYVLEQAVRNVPFYRQQWQNRRRQGDRAAWDLLDNWPLLNKEDLRSVPEAFVDDNCDRRRMFDEHTSGTSGKPLHLWWSRETVQEWYAINEARVRIWHGVSRHDRWAILGGQLITPVKQSQPPFWVWNAGLRQLYLSAYHLSEQNVPHFLEAMNKHEVTYLLGYPSAMSYLARIVLERNLRAPQLRCVISNAEPLLASQVEVLATVFACPVYETYGMAEIVAAGSDCEFGSLHMWPEVGMVEILNDYVDESLEMGRYGRIVGTSLLNVDMPLIRYEIGDRGALSSTDDCPCGRSLPLWQGIEGRTDDIIITPDGRHIGRLDPVFKADLPIIEAQIIQETTDRLRVKVVPTAGHPADLPTTIKDLVRDRVGDMQVVVEEVDTIPRTRSGKFQAVVSLIGD